jgi:hypothetical protein
MKRSSIDSNTILAIAGLLALSIGLAIGLPPIALLGPGAALAVPGCLLIAYAVMPDRAEGGPR